MILADTNVISALRRMDRAEPGLRRWAESTPDTELYLSVVTAMELETGVLRMERRDPPQGARLRRWLREQVLEPFADRLLDFDLGAAMHCARLHVPDPRPERDAMIAATALRHGLPVATRNIADFAAMGIELINPWETIGT